MHWDGETAGQRADGDIRPYGYGERWYVQMGWQGGSIRRTS